MGLPKLNLENHFVMCGWKSEMSAVVREVLQVNPQWTAGELVIIARATQADIQELKSDSRLADVHVIQDDPYSEKALIAASIQTASKVVVFADWANKEESSTETDAKTVMAAMTVEKLAPQTYLIAELLDPNFSIYLKMAHVDEVVYSREYSRILLANAVSSAGVAHVIYDLLNIGTGMDIDTTHFPEEFIGRTFRELASYFDNQSVSRTICVGLLENTGNIHFLKRQALAEAQKSPEMRTVLKNLKHVKEIESNLPKLNPGDDYVVRGNSMAVIIVEKDKHPHKLPPLPLQLIKSEGER